MQEGNNMQDTQIKFIIFFFFFLHLLLYNIKDPDDTAIIGQHQDPDNILQK